MRLERNPFTKWAFGFVIANEGCYLALGKWTLMVWGEEE